MITNLEAVHAKYGLQIATHVWGTSFASQVMVTNASVGTGKQLQIRYFSFAASANGSVRLTTATSLATTFLVLTGTGPVAEEAFITLDDNTGLHLHATAGVGNGYIRVYYVLLVNTGSGLTQ